VSRLPLVPLVLLLLLAPGRPAFAQSTGRFALGTEFAMRLPTTDPTTTVHGNKGPGLVWRFGHGETGWGWQFGLSWFSAGLDRSVGGHDTALGELRVRPVMAGYGYTRVVRRTSVTAAVIAGYAVTRMSLASEAENAYQDRLGAHGVTVDASNTFTAKPEVSVWYDLSKKVGLNVTAGYMIARPTVTVRSSLGQDERRVRADMFMLRIGAVYSIF
jgi:hypothetical protein